MSKLTRRDLLTGTALAVAGLAIGDANASPEPISQAKKPTGKRLRVGIIGVGGKGWSGMQAAAEHAEIVALCDVDAAARVKGLGEYPRADTFDDYRDMLAQMHGDLDAVVISTPDHHHSIASAIAMKHGLHCYTEKPLTRSIWEARQLANIARKAKVATQMGNQSTASTPMRKVAALIRNGHFGSVKAIHLWTDRAGGWWKQGVERPKTGGTPPKNLNFDLWLGPRPRRPFAEGYHPFAWRGWWDFGTGSLGDMGCHIFNMPHMALGLNEPISVQAQTSGHNRDSFPSWAIVNYEFGARNGHGPFTLTWYDGGKRPDASLAPDFEIGGNGSIIVCEKGTIFSPNEFNNEYHLLGKNPTIPDIEVRESPGHMKEFIDAAMGGEPAVSNFPNYSGPLTESVLLGNLAIWANGPRLEWDAKRMKVKGTDEFDSLIKPTLPSDWPV